MDMETYSRIKQSFDNCIYQMKFALNNPGIPIPGLLADEANPTQPNSGTQSQSGSDQQLTPTPQDKGRREMSEMKHTQDNLKIFGKVCVETVNTGSTVAECKQGDPFHLISRDEQEANARRLVACWNACSELLDTELSQGVVALHKFSYVVNEREEAKQQRNQLVEALQMAVEFAGGIVAIQSLPNNGSVMKLIKLWQSALKSATGE
jgi:hypothetical protein